MLILRPSLIFSVTFVSVFVFVARLRKEIQPAIPEITKWLEDQDLSVRQVAVSGLLAFAEHGM